MAKSRKIGRWFFNRAVLFFRRSIKHSKQYRCLNGRLCGQKALVPTRRACKYCRFQRCIELGMLESKLQLHSEDRAKIATFSKKIPAITSDIIFLPDAIGQILKAFTILRRKTKFDFFAQYEREFACMRGGNAETSYLAEVKESPTGGHDMKLVYIEYNAFNRLARNEAQLFELMNDNDWERYAPCLSAQYFHLFNRVLATVRFKGHETNRSFQADGSYFTVDYDKTLCYWDYILQGITGENPKETYRALHAYMFSVTQLILQVAQRVADAHLGNPFNIHSMCQENIDTIINYFNNNLCLDEVETSALLFLLFTNNDCTTAVSPHIADHLRRCREKMLRELAVYINSTGREVYQRVAAIVFLTSEFQNLRNLSNYVVLLMYHATAVGILPDDFRVHLERAQKSLTA